MGTVTVNIKDDAEKELRENASIRFGKKKGRLGKAITQAIRLWAKKQKESDEAKTLSYLEDGFEMGELKYSKRSELHER